MVKLGSHRRRARIADNPNRTKCVHILFRLNMLIDTQLLTFVEDFHTVNFILTSASNFTDFMFTKVKVNNCFII